MKKSWVEKVDTKRREARAWHEVAIEKAQASVDIRHEKAVEVSKKDPPIPVYQFEKELKALKREVQAISRANAFNEQRHNTMRTSRAMDDRQALYCRRNFDRFTIRELAAKFSVSERCVERCLKGITYKHLNKLAKPQF